MCANGTSMVHSLVSFPKVCTECTKGRFEDRENHGDSPNGGKARWIWRNGPLKNQLKDSGSKIFVQSNIWVWYLDVGCNPKILVYSGVMVLHVPAWMLLGSPKVFKPAVWWPQPLFGDWNLQILVPYWLNFDEPIATVYQLYNGYTYTCGAFIFSLRNMLKSSNCTSSHLKTNNDLGVTSSYSQVTQQKWPSQNSRKKNNHQPFPTMGRLYIYRDVKVLSNWVVVTLYK